MVYDAHPFLISTFDVYRCITEKCIQWFFDLCNNHIRMHYYAILAWKDCHDRCDALALISIVLQMINVYLKTYIFFDVYIYMCNYVFYIISDPCIMLMNNILNMTSILATRNMSMITSSIMEGQKNSSKETGICQ